MEELPNILGNPDRVPDRDFKVSVIEMKVINPHPFVILVNALTVDPQGLTVQVLEPRPLFGSHNEYLTPTANMEHICPPCPIIKYTRRNAPCQEIFMIIYLKN
jgi:hypothetical protein